MSEKAKKASDVVSLDVETILQTTEGRIFLNQLNTVSKVLRMIDSTVEFKGEELLKTGYVSDCKSIQLFKCPNGYFLFLNKAFTKNNLSFAEPDIDGLLDKIADNEIKDRLEKELSETA
jgi:hypothetical protein